MALNDGSFYKISHAAAGNLFDIEKYFFKGCNLAGNFPVIAVYAKS